MTTRQSRRCDRRKGRTAHQCGGGGCAGHAPGEVVGSFDGVGADGGGVFDGGGAGGLGGGGGGSGTGVVIIVVCHCSVRVASVVHFDVHFLVDGGLGRFRDGSWFAGLGLFGR